MSQAMSLVLRTGRRLALFPISMVSCPCDCTTPADTAEHLSALIERLRCPPLRRRDLNRPHALAAEIKVAPRRVT